METAGFLQDRNGFLPLPLAKKAEDYCDIFPKALQGEEDLSY